MDTTVVLLLVIFVVLVIVGSLLPRRARRTRRGPSAREDANDRASARDDTRRARGADVVSPRHVPAAGCARWRVCRPTSPL